MDFFMYLSVIEGAMIVCMLGWEIFWLRRMYQALQSMPTAEQFAETVEMLKNDRDAIVGALSGIIATFEPIKGILSSGMLGSLFGSKRL
jgi:hypothetical protein